MKLSDIKTIALKILKGAWHKFKETLTLPYAKIYIASSVFMVIFFVIVTFPYDVLIRRELKSLEKNAVVDTIYAGEIEFNFIDVISVNNLMLILKSGDEISIKDIVIDGTTNPYSLLVSKSYSGAIKLAGIKYVTPRYRISFNMNTNLNIELDKATGIPTNGAIRSFIIQNASIAFPENKFPPPLGMIKLDRPMLISSINASAVLKNRTLTLSGFKVFGNDIRGEISGTVQIDKIIGNSRLNLKIAIDPESGILSEDKDLLVSFIKDGSIILNVEGTLANPNPSLVSGAPPVNSNPAIKNK